MSESSEGHPSDKGGSPTGSRFLSVLKGKGGKVWKRDPSCGDGDAESSTGHVLLAQHGVGQKQINLLIRSKAGH